MPPQMSTAPWCLCFQPSHSFYLELCPACFSSANLSVSNLICPHPMPPSCSFFPIYNFFETVFYFFFLSTVFNIGESDVVCLFKCSVRTVLCPKNGTSSGNFEQRREARNLLGNKSTQSVLELIQSQQRLQYAVLCTLFKQP